MKKTAFLILSLMLLGALGFAQGQAPSGSPTVAMVLDRAVTNVEHEFVPLVEAMPDDKFTYAPTQGEFKGVRNFNEMARHVALTNDQLASAILGQKSTIENGKNDNGPELKTKAEVVAMVKDSFAKLHKAMATVNDKNLVEMIDGPWGGKMNRLGMSTLAVSHAFDHYGQMVEYLRSNGIIPPASRQQ
jgi:uncharacterized damage-inducible protein DinB